MSGNGHRAERLDRVVAFIAAFSEEHGYPPTLREIGDGVGVSSTSVVGADLDVLAYSGRITRRPGCARTLRVVEDGEALQGAQ